MKLCGHRFLKSSVIFRYIHSHIDLAIDLCESENYDDMTTLISSHVKRNYPDTYCKNALLNTLLQEKKVIADQSKIQCWFRIILPEHFDSYFRILRSQAFFQTC